MLGHAKPGEVRALFVYHTIQPLFCRSLVFLLFFVSLLLFWIWECNEWITAQNQQQQQQQWQQQLWSQWSDPGTVSDLLHQALREAWQIQHHTGGQRGGGGWRRWAGPKGLSQSPCSICLPHPSSLHILRRAETASHAETNVKINHYDLSCSALTCSPLVTFAFQVSSQAISSSSNKKRPLLQKESIILLHFSAKWVAAQCLPSQCFPWHRTTKQRAAYAVREREQLMLMSHLDNEVWSWQDLSSKQATPPPLPRTWGQGSHSITMQIQKY